MRTIMRLFCVCTFTAVDVKDRAAAPAALQQMHSETLR
jgi:hypothetical protein